MTWERDRDIWSFYESLHKGLLKYVNNILALQEGMQLEGDLVVNETWE